MTSDDFKVEILVMILLGISILLYSIFFRTFERQPQLLSLFIGEQFRSLFLGEQFRSLFLTLHISYICMNLALKFSIIIGDIISYIYQIKLIRFQI